MTKVIERATHLDYGNMRVGWRRLEIIHALWSRTPRNATFKTERALITKISGLGAGAVAFGSFHYHSLKTV